ncbi:hypothetical protein JZ785_26640 [Alicyclobacillus curvatus]|nr:hypothetical protein JZ785_26640 [Alicyclobacillus curvatus]
MMLVWPGAAANLYATVLAQLILCVYVFNQLRQFTPNTPCLRNFAA